MRNPLLGLFLKRFLILLALSSVAVLIGSEMLYRFVKDDTSRDPREVEILIPAGTAERVANGEPVPSIPEELTFVVGDILIVRNQDRVDHTLGPLFIPAQTSSSLLLDKESNYAYTCSFQPTKYLGLDVRPATTLGTRLQAVFMAAPATAALLFVYSVLVWPVQKKAE